MRSAREDAGLSQEEFGQALGYGATMISAFEHGRRRMKLEDLARACIVLKKDPQFFLDTDDVENIVEATPIGYKLRAELQGVAHEQVAGSVLAFLDELEHDLSLSEPVPDLSHLSADAAAREVLHLAGATSPPVQMEDVCAALEIPLEWRKFPEELSALVLQIREGHYVIGVNEDHPPVRRRFSIAHEVGHVVLRHEASYYVEYAVHDAWEPPGYRYLDERYANAFAASLLMDERWARRDWADGLRTISTLAKRYEVSQAAMGFRVANLTLA